MPVNCVPICKTKTTIRMGCGLCFNFLIRKRLTLFKKFIQTMRDVCYYPNLIFRSILEAIVKENIDERIPISHNTRW